MDGEESGKQLLIILNDNNNTNNTRSDNLILLNSICKICKSLTSKIFHSLFLLGRNQCVFTTFRIHSVLPITILLTVNAISYRI